jgi:ankyrin repeat protein
MRWRWLWAVFLLTASEVTAESPLYWALANNDALEVWNLTAAEVPATLDETGGTVSAWAVARGNAEAVDALVWRGVPLNGVDDRGRNLLFDAASLGRLDLFDKIVAQGARVDQIDLTGQTLVHAAALSPHTEMLTKLLALGLGATERTALGLTPLMVACAGGRAQEAALLLAWGAVPEDEDYLGRNVRGYAESSGDEATLAVITEALTPWSIEAADAAPLP